MLSLQFVYWGALSQLPAFIKNESTLLAAFVATLLISLATAAMGLARYK